MFSKRDRNPADEAAKSTVVKLKPAEKLANELPLKIILTIKSTGFYNYKPEDGDDLFEIAAIETLNGKETGEKFQAFVRIENQELRDRELTHCRKTLGAMKKTKDAEALCDDITSARSFREIQPALLAFLQRNIECTILVHNISHVLTFLRHKMDDAGKEQLAIMQNSMIDMTSKAAALSHLGLYKGGLIPAKIETNKETYKSGRTFYKFTDLCAGFGVHLTNYSGFSAKRDAELLVKVDANMQALLAKQAEAEAAPAEPKRLRK